MNALRIVVLGFLGITAVLIAVSIYVWRDKTREKEGLRVLREMTPESLIAKCGEPNSNTGIHDHHGESYSRTIQYKGTNFPYWVRLEFIRDTDSRWHLTHFASPSVGVSPANDNAYIAIPVFPCMASKDPHSSL